MSEPIIQVEAISKKFCRDLHRSLIYAGIDIFREAVGRSGRAVHLRKREFWALQNIAFKLARGETLGLVGQNGSGKTTLLRIISGVLKPTKGRVIVKGSVAPLLATGSAGFSNILTGRENALITMAVLGLEKREAVERLGWLTAFSELQDAIDAPLRTYSSGMRARLWFSCAVAVRPDVLILDEVLAVGDFRFRAKCREYLTKMKAEGTGFIFVSHDAHAITSFCDRAILLREGQIVTIGDPRDVMKTYGEEVLSGRGPENCGRFEFAEKSGTESTGLDLTAVTVAQFGSGERPRTGERWEIHIEGVCRRDVGAVGFTVNVGSLGGGVDGRLVSMNSELEGRQYDVKPGTFRLKLECGPCVLMPGTYGLSVVAHRGVLQFDEAVNLPFAVEADDFASRSDIVHQPRLWPASISQSPEAAVAR